MDKPDTAPKPLRVPGFWNWLLRRDNEGDRGLRNIANRWLIFHAMIGLLAAYFIKEDAGVIAKTVALPGSAILIGLAFGWAGRSAGLLQDKSFSKFLIEHGPSPEGYVYAFQLAVLTVLSFIACALILAIGGFGLSIGSHAYDDGINRAILFSIGSIAVRES